MIYAVISDLHANLEALRAVLGAIDHGPADTIVCLGDIVGYNANPNECVELLRRSGARSIVGNHDRAAIGVKDASDFGTLGRRAIRWTRSVLTGESARFLASLPTELSVDGRFFAVHGALHPEPNDDLHLSTEARVTKSLHALATGRFGSNVCFFGHTHRAVVWELRRGQVRCHTGSELELLPHAHYLINPGSVGQPRDGDQRAAYALYDAERRSVRFCRVTYDFEAAESRTRAMGLLDEPPRLHGALDRLVHRLARTATLRPASMARRIP